MAFNVGVKRTLPTRPASAGGLNYQLPNSPYTPNPNNSLREIQGRMATYNPTTPATPLAQGPTWGGRGLPLAQPTQATRIMPGQPWPTGAQTLPSPLAGGQSAQPLSSAGASYFGSSPSWMGQATPYTPQGAPVVNLDSQMGQVRGIGDRLSQMAVNNAMNQGAREAIGVMPAMFKRPGFSSSSPGTVAQAIAGKANAWGTATENANNASLEDAAWNADLQRRWQTGRAADFLGQGGAYLDFLNANMGRQGASADMLLKAMLGMQGTISNANASDLADADFWSQYGIQNDALKWSNYLRNAQQMTQLQRLFGG